MGNLYLQDNVSRFNVLFMASSKNIGLTFNLTRLAVALKRFGHKIVIVSEPQEEESGLFEEIFRSQIKCYKVHGLDNTAVKSTIAAASTVGKIIDQNNVDIIHAQGMHQLIVAFLSSKLFSSRKSVAIVTSVHTTLAGSLYENITVLLESFLLGVCSDLTITVAEETARKLVRFGLQRSTTVTIYNAIDLGLLDSTVSTNDFADVLPPHFRQSRYTVLGYFARLVPLKGHEYLLRAIPQISKNSPNAKFVLAGDGPLKAKLKKQSRELGIEEDVFFAGRINHTQLYNLLKVLHIYVSPSLGELFSFAVLEAMAAGKPIVATNVGGIPEAVTDGVNGYLVPPRDPTSLAKKILMLIREPNKAAEMGARGRKMVEQRFSTDVIAGRLSNLYQLALKTK